MLYGLLGWSAEVAFTGIHDYLAHRDRRLPSRTSLWMLPIYGLIAPLFEPAHDLMRSRLGTAGRAVVYGIGFHTVEYATGWSLRKLLGAAPWDYSHARLHVDGLIRLDYFPLWALVGVALERVHDRLAAAG